MIKQLTVQLIGIAVVGGFGIAAIRGEVPTTLYLSLAAAFCAGLLLGLIYLWKRPRAANMLARAMFVQQMAFVAFLICMNLICVEMVIAGRSSIDGHRTPVYWLFIVATLGWVITIVPMMFLYVLQALQTVWQDIRR